MKKIRAATLGFFLALTGALSPALAQQGGVVFVPPITPNDCASWKGINVLQDAGSPCGSGGSGLNQLTGDVTAGPGTGSQAATVVNGSSITNSSIPNSGLVHPSLTIAGHSVALGGTQTLSASDLTNGVSGTGAVCLASGSSCSGSGAVSSVTGQSGITVSPTTGATVVSATASLCNSGANITGTTYSINLTAPGDLGSTCNFTGTGAIAVSLGAAVYGDGFNWANNGTATTTITATGNINGASTLVLTAGQSASIYADPGSATWWAAVANPTGGSTSFANPSATAGPTAVNGSATTAMRSDAAPAIQKASAAQFGIVETDGSTITPTAGVIACTTATNSQLGCVKPDGSSITISGGVISAPTGGSGTVTTLTAGTNVTFSSGATCTTTCTINASGGGGSPGGSNTQLQYNNSSAFGGISGLTSDGTSLTAFQLNSGGISYLTSPTAGTFQFGAADAASPVAQTDAVQNVVGGTSNTAGANRIFAGSKGTGTGAPGNIIFQTGSVGNSSASTQNALATVLTLGPSSVLGSAASQTGFLYATTWNTSANPGTAFQIKVTDTAETGTAYLLQVLGGTSGATDEFHISTSGVANFSGGAANSGQLTTSNGQVSLNASSNFNTLLNTGTSTGTITLGNSSNLGKTVLANPSATSTGDVPLCWTTVAVISQGSVCGTSLEETKNIYRPSDSRYVSPSRMADNFDRLTPISFTFKKGDQHEHFGFGARATAAIDPRCGAYDKQNKLFNYEDRCILAWTVAALQRESGVVARQQTEINGLKRQLAIRERR